MLTLLISIIRYCFQDKQYIKWKQIAKQYKHNRDQYLKQFLNKIQPQIDNLQHKYQNIIQATASQLALKLSSFQYTSYEITLCFIHKTLKLSEHHSIITEYMFQQALNKAKQLDTYRKQSGKKNWKFQNLNQKEFLPPFFGIPVSLKDSIDVQGKSSAVGIISKLLDKIEKDGYIVKIIKQWGMIPFVKTNTPILNKSIQCNNLIYGRTTNPFDNKRTSGGSSGGQGALVSLNGSPIGIGTDIGGSLRIPAQFCKLHTLKTSYCRSYPLGNSKFNQILDGNKHVVLAFGALTKCIEDLAYFYHMLFHQRNQKLIDCIYPYIKQTPFDIKLYKEPKMLLKIGYIKSYKQIQAHRAGKRAVEMAVSVLREEFELVQIEEPFSLFEIFELFVSMMLAGGYQSFKKSLENQKVTIQIQGILFFLKHPIIMTILKNIIGLFDQRLAKTLVAKSLKNYQICHNVQKINELRQRMITFWTSNNIDLWVTPNMPCPAFLHSYSSYLLVCCTYNSIWNLVDYPSGYIPLTEIKKEEQIYDVKFKDFLDKMMQRNLINSHGLSVGVQIIGKPYSQQIILNIMNRLKNNIK